MEVDIDLWFRGPDGIPVGFNNLGSPTANLLRDDLGNKWDFLPINHEIIATRGAPPGEYQFNVYYYRGDISPVPVKFSASLRKPGGELVTIALRDVPLRFMTQEVTIIRFTLNQSGDIVPGSLSEIHRPIATIGGPPR